jgi:hypothetical protein
VPYRDQPTQNRARQLAKFVSYMPPFLEAGLQPLQQPPQQPLPLNLQPLHPPRGQGLGAGNQLDSGQHQSDQQLSDQQLSDQQLSDQQLSDQQLSDQHLSDQQLSDQATVWIIEQTHDGKKFNRGRGAIVIPRMDVCSSQLRCVWREK